MRYNSCYTKKSKRSKRSKRSKKNTTKKFIKKYKITGGSNTERIILGNLEQGKNVYYLQRDYDIDKIPSTLTCHIDDYYFKIICNTNLDRRLGTFIISSEFEDFREYNKFIVYASQSELDFRRLLYMENIASPLYKGKYDYVQQTLIDFRLQKFICQAEQSYIVPLDNFFSIMDHFNKIIDVPTLKDVKDTIDNPIRRLKIPPFNSNKNLCGQANIKDDECSIDEEAYRKLIRELEEFSQKLEGIFNIDTPNFLYRYKKFKNNEDYLLIDIYSVNLIDKSNEENKFTLYFMIYDLCIFNSVPLYNDSSTDAELKYSFDNIHADSYKQNKVCKYRNYYIPISIVPYNVKITKYGLPSQYIPTGNYTCKALDYTGQCSNYENNYIIGNTHYSFIGDRYNNLFPFNIIKLRYPDVLNKHVPQDISQEMIDFFSSVDVPQFTVNKAITENENQEPLDLLPMGLPKLTRR